MGFVAYGLWLMAYGLWLMAYGLSQTKLLVNNLITMVWQTIGSTYTNSCPSHGDM